MHEDVMENILRTRLRERGLDTQSIATSNAIGIQITCKILHVCKDTNGAVGLTGVPKTWWLFDGVICTVDDVVFLIDRNVAHEWGILEQ
jgi:hypothetical protein